MQFAREQFKMFIFFVILCVIFFSIMYKIRTRAANIFGLVLFLMTVSWLVWIQYTGTDSWNFHRLVPSLMFLVVIAVYFLRVFRIPLPRPTLVYECISLILFGIASVWVGSHNSNWNPEYAYEIPEEAQLQEETIESPHTYDVKLTNTSQNTAKNVDVNGSQTLEKAIVSSGLFQPSSSITKIIYRPNEAIYTRSIYPSIKLTPELFSEKLDDLYDDLGLRKKPGSWSRQRKFHFYICLNNYIPWWFAANICVDININPNKNGFHFKEWVNSEIILQDFLNKYLSNNFLESGAEFSCHHVTISDTVPPVDLVAKDNVERLLNKSIGDIYDKYNLRVTIEDTREVSEEDAEDANFQMPHGPVLKLVMLT